MTEASNDTASATGDAVEREVRAEQARGLASHIPLVSLGGLFCANLTWLLLRDGTASAAFAAWLVAVHLLIGVRFVLYRRFLHRDLRSGNVAPWRSVFAGLAAVSGTIWACLPPIFIAPGDAYTLLVITVLCIGMVAGSLASESVYLPAFVGYSAPVMLSLSATIFLAGGEHHAFGVVGIVFFVAVG